MVTIPLEITNDLKKGMSLEDTLIKYGTNLKELFCDNFDMNYIRKKGRRFYIRKGSKNKVFGSYASVEDARIVRDALIRVNWDINELDNICAANNIIRMKHGGKRR